MIANFRMQAELSAVESTEDGKNIVLGTVDGCLSVLAIADPAKPEMKKYLAALPSRDEEVRMRLELRHQRYVGSNVTSTSYLNN
jgi:cation transport ATPase